MIQAIVLTQRTQAQPEYNPVITCRTGAKRHRSGLFILDLVESLVLIPLGLVHTGQTALRVTSSCIWSNGNTIRVYRGRIIT
jgi:hypothetical protein